MLKIRIITIAILWTFAEVYGETDTTLDLGKISADAGLKKWIEFQMEIVGTPYFQYYDEVEFVLTPKNARPLEQLVLGNELSLIKSTLQYSPNGGRSVNMFVHNIETHSTGWVPHQASPDKSVYLFEASDSMGWSILDVGSSSDLYSVRWVDDNICIVFGLVPDVRIPRLNAWRLTVNLPNIRRERFLGPRVNDRQSRALDDQWRKWLQYRYPSINWWNE
jgi:hypothetical protein